MKKVFIDPGHGGKDPGAVGINGLREKDIVLSVSLLIGEVLKRHNVGVFYSRIQDEFIELSERAKMANRIGVDAFVSVHCNSFSNPQAQGLETFSHPSSKNGIALAKCIQDSILNDKLYTKNRGLKTANFAVLRLTSMTSTLVELGFISNVEDVDILKNKQNELAEGVAKGILNFLGIKYIPLKAREEDEDNKIKVRIKGKLHHFDGVFTEKTNYVSVRQIAETLGYKVDWDSKNKEVLINLRR